MLAALVLLWQLLASTGLINRRFYGSPADVVTALVELARSGELALHLGVSLWRATVGLAIGTTLGLVFGVLVGLSKLGEDLFDPFFQAIRTLPLLGLIPLFILWFGLGETPRIALIALASFFPVYLNTFKGIRGVDARFIELANSYGVKGPRLIRDVIAPAAFPAALVGFRYSLGIAWLCLVIAEQVNANEGLGWIIIQANLLAQTALIMTALVIYAVIGVAADSLVRLVERRALRWQNAFEGA
ncbi:MULTISPECIES: ABC transporter permease subunit [unclassified Chelatococcus]|uniref:ABC transporter permease n=1 Tax=unclassified Chelatococcus TaxID=2638111 RepID=UPI001BCCCC4E|nr:MULTISPECIES: ABC transporter permease subunit [unclassified Chelatococcus]CAH1656051.1 aliphatic sulfonate ABC transporter membrane subunit [Hyphomicrobiales bacterium]MBS7742514.1 ABC transporter permease subunit [Chelatococcus sp. HY11]MBX3542368.1 ABC transporter permease subunit [Chelatococcus sp.]MCO5075414.1 ABC transporter permease subunit [Chelatococcus sp.]CAH1695723.1 aliphatic sulfonate ABC transporter membrane subunit [Hyphomicrobiales bacterium]